MTDAYGAKTTADLDALLSDLPSERPKRTPTRFVVSLFGSSERQGRLRLRNRLWCIALFGNIDVDLRQATLEGEVITIVALGFMCAIDVYVPEGVEADIRGFTVFGHKDANGNDVPPRPETPLIRMVAFGAFVGIDLWRVPVAWAKRGWGEVRSGEVRDVGGKIADIAVLIDKPRLLVACCPEPYQFHRLFALLAPSPGWRSDAS